MSDVRVLIARSVCLRSIRQQPLQTRLFCKQQSKRFEDFYRSICKDDEELNEKMIFETRSILH